MSARAASPADAAIARGVWIAGAAFARHDQIESTIYGEQHGIALGEATAAAWRRSRDPAAESALVPAVRNG